LRFDASAYQFVCQQFGLSQVFFDDMADKLPERMGRTTDGWSKHWVNDRISPRSPFSHQSNALEIDAHLITAFAGTG
jgi:hypothetical protein